MLSACRGVTDALLQLVALAERQDEAWRAQLEALRERHAHLAAALLPATAVAEYLADFDHDAADLDSVLRTMQVMRTAGEHVRDLVAGYGEIWSTRLFRRFLQQRGRARRRCSGSTPAPAWSSQWGPLGPGIQWDESRANAAAAAASRRRARS